MMESINCPVLGCSYSTPANTDAAVVAALLNGHTTIHNSTNTAEKVEKVRRPTISTAAVPARSGLTPRRDGTTTKQQQSDRARMRSTAVGNLECCDESLRKDLTRAAGGSLTSKSEIYILAAIRLLAVRDENTMVVTCKSHFA